MPRRLIASFPNFPLTICTNCPLLTRYSDVALPEATRQFLSRRGYTTMKARQPTTERYSSLSPTKCAAPLPLRSNGWRRRFVSKSPKAEARLGRVHRGISVVRGSARGLRPMALYQSAIATMMARRRNAQSVHCYRVATTESFGWKASQNSALSGIRFSSAMMLITSIMIIIGLQVDQRKGHSQQCPEEKNQDSCFPIVLIAGDRNFLHRCGSCGLPLRIFTESMFSVDSNQCTSQPPPERLR
jgi:hypothetical protein